MPPSNGGRWLAKRDGGSSPPPQRYTINFIIQKEFTLLFQTMQEFLHPQSIVQITTIAIPATARRVVAPYRGFVQTSIIVKPSSPRRVAATADGWCLGFALLPVGGKTPSFTSHYRLWAEDTLESSYKLQSLQFLPSPAGGNSLSQLR